ncbi:hypothetical protein [Burkholderia cepacia]|uniref:hypothetical protein n=1 Tax=Burkholderia cepacia TaxID=292 RepID=UPI00158D7F79|nr:hypothetical protein [Burkholderia cepacia]MCA8160605.1 hypothetical protein [Burkholderia cepacia]
MTAQNEKSPLTRNASGQENGTEIEARGLSSADNGMPAENLSERKIPAPKQASEAANQRPSKENATAESIVGVRATGGNGTSSKVGRADALTVAAALNAYEKASIAASECDSIEDARIAFVHSILAASPLEQPAAAPNDSGTVSVACFSGSYPHGTITYSQLAPSPADERAAFPRYAEWLHLRTHGEWSSGVPEWARDHSGRMNDFTAASAVIEELAAARASSANGTGAEGVRAWETDDGRVISDEQKQQALRDGGASASSVRPFSIALGRIGAVLSMAAEAVAIPAGWLKLAESARSLRSLYHNTHCNPEGFRLSVEALADEAAKLLATPQPAQADARVGLTDALRRAREELSIVEWENDPPNRVVKLFDEIDALLAAHAGEPEPRAEVTECCNHTWESCHKGEGCEFRMWLAARTGASS